MASSCIHSILCSEGRASFMNLSYRAEIQSGQSDLSTASASIERFISGWIAGVGALSPVVQSGLVDAPGKELADEGEARGGLGGPRGVAV